MSMALTSSRCTLILKGFVNPRPGVYPVLVEAESGAGGAMGTGVGRLHIRPSSTAGINATSVFAGMPPFPNRSSSRPRRWTRAPKSVATSKNMGTTDNAQMWGRDSIAPEQVLSDGIRWAVGS